jgi:hypothetical protein
MRSRTPPSGTDEDLDFGDVDPRRRANLLESEAEELRQRLDALLVELSRHRRRSPEELLRRYAVPAMLTMVVATTGILAVVGWRRRARRQAWSRLGARTQARLRALLSA